MPALPSNYTQEQYDFYKTMVEPELRQYLDKLHGKGKWRVEFAPDFCLKILVTKKLPSEIHFGNLYIETLKVSLMKDKQSVIGNFLAQQLGSTQAHSELTALLHNWNALKKTLFPRMRSREFIEKLDNNMARSYANMGLIDGRPIPKMPHIVQEMCVFRPDRCSKLSNELLATVAVDRPGSILDITDKTSSIDFKGKLASGELSKASLQGLRNIIQGYLKQKGRNEEQLFPWRIYEAGEWIVPRDSMIKREIPLLSWLLFLSDPVSIVKSLPDKFQNLGEENGFALFPVHDYYPIIVRTRDKKAMLSAYIEQGERKVSGSYRECVNLGYTSSREFFRLDTKNNEFVPYDAIHKDELSIEAIIMAVVLRQQAPEAFAAANVVQEAVVPPPKKCANCGTQLGLKLCSGCKKVYYCGGKCQKADWDKHKSECKKAAPKKA